MNSLALDKKSPEEVELAKKLVELVALKSEWETRDLNLIILKLELMLFDSKWTREITSRRDILDDLKSEVVVLEAEIIAIKERLNVKPELGQLFTPQSEKASETKSDSHQSTHNDESEPPSSAEEEFEDDNNYENVDDDYEDEPEKKKTGSHVKSQYRALAKVIHPDLATCEEERVYRELLMKELNSAYSHNDLDKISEVSATWSESMWSIQIAGVVGELVKTILKIANIQEKLNKVDEEFLQIHNGTDYKFWRRIEDLAKDGIDWWQEEIGEIEQEIAEEQASLSKLKRRIKRFKYEATFKSRRIGTAEVTTATRIAQGRVIYIKCSVIGGKLVQGAIVRIHRDDKVLLNANIEAIRWQNCAVKEVFEGNQCALCIPNYTPMPNDLIECFQIQKRKDREAE